MAFSINSDNNTFNQKQKILYDQLDIAAKCNNRLLPSKPKETDNPPTRLASKIQKTFTRHYKRKESMFKRPEAPITKCLASRTIPNYRMNPHKYTKYSLKDVADEDLSERGNARAALTFLKELEDRKMQATTEVIVPEKIEFKKTATIKIAGEDSDDKKYTFKNSKVVMPEYVVGQKIKKDKKNIKLRTEGNSTRQLKLDHLLDNEDDDDE